LVLFIDEGAAQLLKPRSVLSFKYQYLHRKFPSQNSNKEFVNVKMEKTRKMSESKLLFVRESSGLVKEVNTGFALLLPIALTLGPWFAYGGPQISTWFAGAHLTAMFAIGSFTVFFEALALMCLMLSMPRSGASYYFTGRGLSPIFGVMEGWRSVITNPVFRGTGSFLAVQVFAGGLYVLGSAAGDAGLVALGAFLSTPLPLFAFAAATIFIGFIFGYLSVKWLGWFVIILGLVNILAIVVADVAMLTTPLNATNWDAVFGAGNYATIAALNPTSGLGSYLNFSWGAVGPALILTVGMMWPYLIMPVAGEVAQPSKNIPISNLGGWLGIAVFFILSGYAAETSMGAFLYQNNLANMAGAGGIFPGWGNYAAVALKGGVAGWFVVLSPIYASILDSPSNALWVTRPFHSMAMDRFCPEVFASVHPKYHVPHVSLYFWLILAMGTLTYATILQAFFGTALSALVGVGYTYVFIRWQMALAAVGLPYYRPTLWERSGAWKILGVPLISIGGIVSGVVFFWAIVAYTPGLPYEVAFTIFVYLWGQLMYLYYGAKNKAKGIEISAIFGQLPPE
jgi:APA family basic amino acid/polyamine antiporter